MAEQEWLRAEGLHEASAGPSSRPPAHFELRPLSLGEVLDRTFTLYRSRFWLFAGISMVAAAVQAVGQGVALAAAQRLMASAIVVASPQSLPAVLTNIREIGAAQAGTYVVLLLFFLVSAITQAGTALAVYEVYLQRPAAVREVLGRIAPRSGRWIGIALWQVWSLIWIPLAVGVPMLAVIAWGLHGRSPVLAGVGAFGAMLAFLAGLPCGLILYLRNALAIPAAVAENLQVRPAMRRSKVLSRGSKGRVFVVLLVAGALLEVVGVLQTPLTLVVTLNPHQGHYVARALALVIAFVGHTVVAPIALIGLMLLYLDQRVRKEAFDLDLLLAAAREGGARPGPLPSTETYAPPVV